jgi:hypothetical protein
MVVAVSNRQMNLKVPLPELGEGFRERAKGWGETP